MTLNNLCSGNYHINFSFNNTTRSLQGIVYNRCLNTPPVYTTSTTGPNECNGSMTTISPTNLTYHGTVYLEENTNDGGIKQSTVLFNLCVGTHTYRVQDYTNNCLTDITATITSDEITNPCDILPVRAMKIEHASYSVGQCSGEIYVDAFGFSPFTYELDNTPVSLPIQNLCPGNHTLKIIDAFGCESVSNHTIIDSSSLVLLSPSIIKQEDNQQVSIYPNPFNDKIIISLDQNQESEIIITDIMGNIVVTKTSKENKIEIDMTNLSMGQYIVLIKNEDTFTTRKIIKN